MRSSLATVLVMAISFGTQQPPLAAEQASAGAKYALLVGVRQYPKGGLRALPYAERDVTELGDVLVASGYRKENVRVLVQSKAGVDDRFRPAAENIRAELKLLLKRKSTADSVLIALAGHGVQLKNSKDHYFCPMDAQLDKPETLIPLKELYAELETCGAGTKLLFVDACRNDPIADRSRSAAVETVTRPKLPPPPGGIAALFSCSEGQRAFEDDELKHGVFFYHLIEGLKGKADVDGDGQVTLLELMQYTEKRVDDFVQGKHRAEQVPELLGQVRGRLVLAVYKRGR